MRSNGKIIEYVFAAGYLLETYIVDVAGFVFGRIYVVSTVFFLRAFAALERFFSRMFAFHVFGTWHHFQCQQKQQERPIDANKCSWLMNAYQFFCLFD